MMGKKRIERLKRIQAVMDLHHDAGYIVSYGENWEENYRERCSCCGNTGEPFDLHLADMIEREVRK